MRWTKSNMLLQGHKFRFRSRFRGLLQQFSFGFSKKVLEKIHLTQQSNLTIYPSKLGTNHQLSCSTLLKLEIYPDCHTMPSYDSRIIKNVILSQKKHFI
ncbi:hypothetical protein O181_022804 [Austropuccinia psidii MF-1]|uniref:Uncharacterized protein n=1 Tax=Austropuccinia psidii MF-1 TaxID=1389203 RepID=A0A9Q3CDB3_9BASI|nr:hypothetical protein [Austropuccinia psidii MF-1]